MSQDLCYLPASEALRMFRSRELSPVELMEAVIARSEQVEGEINAFAEQLFETALAEARRAESRYAGAGRPPRALEGLPVAVKESQPLAGRRWTCGSLAREAFVADVTHPVVERILAAGGIIHARTTTPEFNCAGFTHSRLWGTTRNPWNRAYSPGGSSGGSAAALAAGTTALATGSDIAGSIRLPAAFCGVVGFKPPFGRVPSLPPENADTYHQAGPLARTVADCALLQNVIAGPHPADAATVRPPVEVGARAVDLRGRRVALCLHLGDYPVEPEIRANARATAEALREAGAAVEEVTLQWRREDVMRAWWIHAAAIFGPLIRERVGERRALATPYIRGFLDAMEAMACTTHFLESVQIEAALHAELSRLLEAYDVLLCPTASVAGLRAGVDYGAEQIVVDGVTLGGYGEALMTTPFNVLGRCPVMAVPSGRRRDGLPTGIQIVGAPYEDVKVFEVAATLEQVRPWFDDPSRRPALPTRPAPEKEEIY